MTSLPNRSGVLHHVCGVAFALMAMSPAANGQAPQLAISGPQDITFALLARAPYQSLFQTEQTRRFRDRNHQLVEVNERLTVDGNGDRTSPFRLEFLGVVGQTLNSAETQRWDITYQRFGSLFYEHGSFRVHDAALAQRNYRLQTFGTVMRAGHLCWRTVVYPRRLDKSVWLVDLDAETGIPFYIAEFDSSGHPLSEVLVTRFTSAMQVGRLGADWAWKPRMKILPVDIGATQKALLDGKVKVIKPVTDPLMPDYDLLRAHVAQNSFNGERSLVQTYCDGIDEFFIVQTAGRGDPFAMAPSATLPDGKTPADTIAYYDDPTLRVYQFHLRGVSFQIAGRGSLTRLDQLSKQVYVQAFQQR